MSDHPTDAAVYAAVLYAITGSAVGRILPAGQRASLAEAIVAELRQRNLMPTQ